MKTLLKSLVILSLVCLFSNEILGQDFKHFNVVKDYDGFSINPNFASTPFEMGLKYRLSNTDELITYKSIRERYKDLFKKVETILDEKEFIIFNYSYNKDGKVIYGNFQTLEFVLPKLNDELLLEIYNTFKEIKVTEIKEENNPEKYPAFGQMTVPFRYIKRD